MMLMTCRYDEIADVLFKYDVRTTYRGRWHTENEILLMSVFEKFHLSKEPRKLTKVELSHSEDFGDELTKMD